MKRAWLLLLLVALACNAQSERSAAPAVTEAASAADTQRRIASSEAPARMIIRNANVSVVVRDAADVLRKVTALVESKGGYIGETRQWKEREQVRASATLRVPAAQLMPTLAAIRNLAVRTEHESVSAQDVLQEHVDLGAQLRNLQAAETELRELLRTVRERTQKASEVIAIHNEITKVRGEIERIQGRLQYLAQMTAFSTITVDLVPDVLAAPVVEPGWQPVATVKAASRALVHSLEAVTDALIWVVLYVLPLALVFAALVLMMRAMWVRARRVRQASAG